MNVFDPLHPGVIVYLVLIVIGILISIKYPLQFWKVRSKDIALRTLLTVIVLIFLWPIWLVLYIIVIIKKIIQEGKKGTKGTRRRRKH